MLRRTGPVWSRSKQNKMFHETFSEKELMKHMNMDRIYRNLAMEKRDYKRPWCFEKDMRGSVIHLTVHSAVRPMQVVGTILDVSHNETHLDAWARLFFRKGKAITWLKVPLMNPAMEYKIVRDRDDVKVWENYIKELGHQKTMWDHGRAKRARKGDNSLFW
eukprot:TRINITY_DN28797_c0_g1_i1.p2 TRINITY_DN28797_c0_g1~~TRINITY_DN28797_c0_g1_i1.p2  ORF type:complete len:178 (+),score=41.97 TRINITY_DN28797_c0_g1_i1:52-534(+)